MYQTQLGLMIVVALVATEGVPPSPSTEELIHYINTESGALWEAGPQKRFGSMEEFRNLLGALEEKPSDRNQLPTVSHEDKDIKLPESFDSRQKWPNCPSIREIRDQSSCGSCWAFGATEAMTDRLCIHSGGTIRVSLSARDLLACCTNCGAGCEGGYPIMAWQYWRNHGIVTGGSMEAGSGCVPYPFPECSHDGRGTRKPCPRDLYDTPQCVSSCASSYSKRYKEDKFFGKSAYRVIPTEESIKKEIYLNGPVEATFDVYEDFAVYRSGIYHHVTGVHEGGHAIKIIGWGVDKGTPYWLIANSWNDEWAEGGYMRILRGLNECRIESGVVAGIPQIP